jgi:20S proteasome alpha/beta subunit
MHAGNSVLHSQKMIGSGTSVLGIKYNGGVVICADILRTYSFLSRFRRISRIAELGTHTLLGATGNLSDFQSLFDSLDRIAYVIQ